MPKLAYSDVTRALLKPAYWVGSSLKDLRACPEDVQDVVGHVFQKKATRGIATPKHELDLIKARLQWAQRHARGEVEEL